MYCPNCQSEYREGFTECAACNTTLVESLPEEQEVQLNQFDELLKVFNESDIALIKSIFEDGKIEYYFKDEFAHRLVPLPFQARLMVRKEHVHDAKLALKAFNIL